MQLRKFRIVAVAVAMLAITDVLLLWSIKQDEDYIQSIAYSIIAPGSDEHKIVDAVTEFTRNSLKRPSIQDVEQMPLLRRWNYKYNPLRVGPVTILQHGQHQLGPCQSNSRVFKALIAAHGIDAKAVAMLDPDLNGTHSVVEVYYSKGPYGIVDPQNGIVYRHPDGRPATIQDLRNDQKLFLDNAAKGWCYGKGPQYPELKAPYPTQLYDFKRVAYFNFRRFGPLKWFVYDTLTYWFGPDGPLLVPRPSWYMIPTKTAGFILNSVAGLIALLCVIRWRRNRRSGSDDEQGRGTQRRPARRQPSESLQTLARQAFLAPSHTNL